VTLLLGQPDEAALGSADRLLASADDLQRLGGLEMLRRMAEDQRQADSCRDRARVYRNARAELTKDEALQLEGWLERAAPVATLDDGLGLFDPLQRTRPAAPKCCDVAYVTAAALACLKSIDGLINEHRETHVKIEWGDTSKEGLMGNVSWGFPRPDPERPLSEDLERLPLRQVWEGWWKERGAEYRDADGAELMRARWCLQQIQRRANRMLPAWLSAIGDAMLGAEEKTSVARAEKRLRALGGTENEGPRLNFAGQIGVILPWLMRLAADRAPGFLLDGLEHAFGLIPEQHRAELGESHWYPGELLWRNYGSPLHEWLELIRDHRRLCAASWQPVHTRRLWCLLRWFDEPGVPAPRCRPSLDIVMGAWRTGAANEADVLDQLIGPRLLARYGRHFGDLAELSGSKDTPEIQACPELKPLIDRCRARIIEVELTRGEAPTAASAPAMSLRSSGGIDVLFPLLRALGRERIARSAGTDNLSKAAVFSHLIGVSMPREADTPQSFAAQAAAVEVEQDQLIDLAIFAPQWASHVEHTIGWPCVADAVWWLHAHTKDKGWRVDEDIREKWKAQIGLLTPLSGEDLLDGAVDVAWFQRFYPKLGAQRWVALDKSAKYTCGGTGHTRARLFAAAMLGNTDKSDLMKRMRDKRQQDAVRALGLPPLASGKAREADLLDRYRAIQEFVRTGRKLGSQRQASEKRAAAIGMDNLARTAGYPDPIRLQWAMEARESADLAKGPIQVKSGDVVVSLSLDEEGAPELAVSRKGKPLASVPASVKKNAQIQELQERKTEMKRAASRTRLSLEQAMIRGDAFRGPELRELSANPVRSPRLGRRVFVNGEAMGYPSKGGRCLEDDAGKVEPIGSSDGLRLAHPHD